MEILYNFFIGKLISVISLIAIFIYIWFWRRYRHWKNKKVKGPTPIIPFGNLKEIVTKKLHLGVLMKNLYEETKHLPYVGIYFFHRPGLLINNLDLAKTILVKDFIHFTDHGFRFNKKTQPLANHLFNVNGAKWKGLRTKLTPAFTSSKMKYMFDTIAVCGEELTEYLKSFSETGDDADIKDIAAKYNTNVIVSCAFGIDSNSFKYPDAEFRKMGKRVFDFNFKRRMVMFMTLFFPEIQEILDGHILEKCVTDFFTDAVAKTVKYREENNVKRNDLLQLLIRLKNNESIDDTLESTEAKENETIDVQLTMLEMTAQAFGFFAAGFETSSTTISLLFYNLAKYQDVQRKLITEIDEVLQKHDNKVTYDALNEMTYMGQVIEETLRLFPPITQLFRVCTKKYKIPHTNVEVDKGTLVIFPITGIHMDPDIYPNPEQFDPDRFSPELKASRHHFSFLSFGEGPRICIGNRFAILQIKIAIVSILRYYEVSLGNQKESDWNATNNSFLFSPAHMNLKLKKR